MQKYNVKITVMRRTEYSDLMALYENPIEHPCDMKIGAIFLSVGGEKPSDFCSNAWKTLAPYAKELASGGGDFFDGWMKNKKSAMLSCDDGFRPVTFYLEAVAA